MDRERMIEEIAQFATQPTLQPHEFTAGQYAEQMSITRRRARHDLNRQVRRGELEKRAVVHDGHHQNAYSRA